MINVCTIKTDGHESKAFWCGRQAQERKVHPTAPSGPSIMLGQGRWEPTGRQLSQEIAPLVVLLAEHRVLHRSCLNFSTSKLLRCPPICQLSQDSLPIRCCKKNTFNDLVSWVFCADYKLRSLGNKVFCFSCWNFFPSVGPTVNWW